ncbi:glycoside hydrolase family 16 protein [Spongiivirga citrea]|uniref:Family 16 glycosylhydrolase n=1 Tax=Spongiivirga citrea TaxID=1481457 RepID=A0A6M0CEX4_9FLAO|nr:glycoside hydrolase family 16 protein [Spongiivirga citrea]NER16311.1 family 16 glycosylhydrolase [Spongiivirga citrea]
MKISLIYSLIMLISVSCSKSDVNVVTVEGPDAEEEPIENPDPTPSGDWELIFEENFDDPSLAQWNIWEGGAFNNEIQLYKKEQLNLENGIISFNAKRETVQGNTNPFDNTTKDFEYVSGRVESKTLFGPTEVAGNTEIRISARIKLPKGNGMWPAFWSYGDDWPTNGEIDILEARGNTPLEFQSNIFYGTEVGTPLTKNEDTEKVHNINQDLTDDFHEYQVIWTENKLQIFFDNQLLHTYDANDKNFVNSLFGKKHQIVLNVAVGGAFFNGVDSSQFVENSQMQVDWVKVYKR